MPLACACKDKADLPAPVAPGEHFHGTRETQRLPLFSATVWAEMLWLLQACLSLVSDQANLPLRQPQRFESTHGRLDIHLDLTTCEYNGPTVSQLVTRCFAPAGQPGQLPGPTLVVSPGDILMITFTNRLSDKDDNSYHNWWQHLNWTNLHFHGGHVSADIPGDDVIELIPPCLDPAGHSCSRLTYRYAIPANHEPGTAWYHPHGHGNALLQVGGGASGTIIIRDPPGKLPEYVDEAPEILLHVNHLPIAQILGYGAQSCVSRCG